MYFCISVIETMNKQTSMTQCHSFMTYMYMYLPDITSGESSSDQRVMYWFVSYGETVSG